MYHDQGLVALKALSFGGGTNFTAGIKGIRTSPDHGTAYDIAGQNEADPSSMRKALFVTKDLIQNRSDYHNFRANALDKNKGRQTTKKKTKFSKTPDCSLVLSFPLSGLVKKYMCLTASQVSSMPQIYI